MLENDFDLDSAILNIVGKNAPQHGSAFLDNEHSQIVYTPAADFVGEDEFEYRLSDE